ncbi:MAG TPA: hypothetical protein VHZ95_21650 [Polyangiales bacterium]|nr:hypothetical protein [Polyangiales bacterium]
MRAMSTAARIFAIGNALLAIALLCGVFLALPVRFWGVDAPSVLMASLLALSSFGLLRQTAWRFRALRISALCELAVGLVAIASMVLAISYLGGIHGEVGRSGLVIALVGSALLIPYLIIYPSLQLVWLGRVSERS